MLSISLLASGELGFKLLEELQSSSYTLAAVFTDRNSQSIIEFCHAQNIPLFIGNPRNGRAADFISRISCEVLLSVNYLFLIESDLIDLPQQYAINFHGSLLPRYRGRTPHVWAIINGESKAGVTAHLIDVEVDNGDILRQMEIDISTDATGGDLLMSYHECYPELVFQVLRDIEKGELQLQKQDKQKATYFGKRSPEDGQINWDWGHERIRNWIRAQAHPYPGAFTFYQNRKVKIHKAIISDHGFDSQQANGTILFSDHSGMIVKTSTGALKLERIEGLRPEEVIIGSCLENQQAVLI